MRMRITQLRDIIREEIEKRSVSSHEVLSRFEDRLSALPPKVARRAREAYESARASMNVISAVRLVARDLARAGYDIGLRDVGAGVREAKDDGLEDWPRRGDLERLSAQESDVLSLLMQVRDKLDAMGDYDNYERVEELLARMERAYAR